MDDETVEDFFAQHEDVIETLLDHAVLEVGDVTVVTSAAPPHDESPFVDRTSRITVSFAAGVA